MQEFIQLVTKELGISAPNAQSATGGVLQMLKEKADPNDFNALLAKLPGASELLAKAPQAVGAGGGGGIGDVLGKAASAVGGKLGMGMELVGMLKGTGIDANKVGPFVSMFVNFVKSKAGAELVQKLLGKLPELAKLAG